ncbi:Na(+)/H(+) antiporter subunit D [Magnetospirillum sp. SS-4]|uniref:Na(+)/H(+) antiporter subunit D n=1 Tax=Magnetospirillum sp. SS-4 TaxID=2681465 RepID=UPI00137D2679|nr:Na(+)/H(+) antiporter subunit D [Magnetospirillum sp. SS-4]CAA7620719.1 NADH-ubiquinone oxidoreductase chain L [Magnetospirillum sp. SS-4]
MTIEGLPPGLLMIAGALLLPFVGAAARRVMVLALPLAVLALVWMLPEGSGPALSFLGQSIAPLRVDALGRLFATIFLLMAAAGALFALGQSRLLEGVAAFVYAGSAVGVVLAGDLITVFVFWELMAVGSTLVLWAAGTPSAARAAMRYVQVHLLGGVVLMVGIVAHVAATGQTAFEAMRPETLGTWLILAGFLINAGAPPFSAWLPDAYPEASWSGMVFLSAFTTKTAVYALIRGFPGAEILIAIGLFMVFYGIIYALLENDMRRILAYSIVNQVGFMVTGVGIGTEMALNGAAAHAFAHILYKALLLMSAGSVLLMTGRRLCSDLGGLFRTMPVTTACGIIGALAISSFPWTSGFVAKSMIGQSAADGGLALTWFLLTAASAGVFLHAGIKFPWFVFFQKDSGLRPADPPWSMRLAMILLSALCVGIGVFPGLLYGLLPHPVDYQPYTAAHVVEMLQLLGFSGLAFFLLLPMMKRTRTVTLDADWLWRRPGAAAATRLWTGLAAVFAELTATAAAAVRSVADHARALHGPRGILARSMSSGGMAAFALVALGLALVALYR